MLICQYSRTSYPGSPDSTAGCAWDSHPIVWTDLSGTDVKYLEGRLDCFDSIRLKRYCYPYPCAVRYGSSGAIFPRKRRWNGSHSNGWDTTSDLFLDQVWGTAISKNSSSLLHFYRDLQVTSVHLIYYQLSAMCVLREMQVGM